ncbi:MAG: HDOD domain-containing protein [Rhodocyclaceae bacterium]|jgi:serine/threonine protein kinase|nr:HDOD domain-containing protein [Rhodocyclaceae bacterium]
MGKFDILRILGTGAQSVVYLAHDPHLEREVAIKSLHLHGRDEARKQALLDEARTVSRLRHPSIVPIFDAGEQDGDPYLVFEFVEGNSLAERLREAGGLPAPRAIEAMLQILDAVEYAHRHGIIHRDLKPSNILLNADGVPRVMDFGIAVRIDKAGDSSYGEGIMGTPAYLAPECINAGLASVQSDIFSAGLILCEMLTGKPVVGGKSVLAVLQRMASEPIRLPPEAAGVVDDRLGDIILKATAMDTAARYADIPALRDALKAWLAPQEAAVPARPAEGGKQSTLDFLLRRMRHKGDFPALSEAISTINRLAASDKESIASLSNTILKDVALTNKLMRLVNSAYYSQAGGGGAISTISRAVMILGFGTVRSIATSLVLMEHLQNQGHAQQLREEFVRAIMSGILARDMARKGMVKDFEEAFICAMFHNLGRMLAYYYFPDETAEIRKQLAQQGGSETAASARVLGISYEELGIGVARSWGFPDAMVGSLRGLPEGPVKKPANNGERLRVLSGLSDQLCSVFEQVPAERHKDELQKICQRFGSSIPFDGEQLQSAMKRSLDEVASYTAAVRLNLQQSALGRQVGAWIGKGTEVGPEDSPADASASIPGNLAKTVAMAAPESDESSQASAGKTEPIAPSLEDVQNILNAGIQDITRSLVEDFALADILRIIVETMYRGIGFQHVLLCIKDARNNGMAAKFGFGPDIEEIIRRFRFPLGGRKDIFDVALSRGADILISDIRDPKISAHIPEWFRKAMAAETFILFPLVIKGTPVGLIYADKERAGELVIPESVLSMLRALRNQAVLAIKQSR